MNKLLPLPKPDGAPLECSVERTIRVWPYVSKCNNPAKGLLTEQDCQALKSVGFHTMRAVCEKHLDLIMLILD